MLGIVFNELLSMIEAQKGVVYTEELIESEKLVSGAAYSNVGNYDVGELVKIVSRLSKDMGINFEILVEEFGKHLAYVFREKYPNFYECKDLFEFLSKLDSHIHVEVKKLYSEACPPKFEATLISPTKMELEYSSKNPFAPLAMGLIIGSAEHFPEQINIRMEDLNLDNPNTNCVFHLEAV